MPHTLEAHKTLDRIHRLFIDNRLSFVSYRMPGQKEVTTMLQWMGEPAIIKDIKSLKNKQGFVFAPFYNSAKTPIRLISPNLVIHGNQYTEDIVQDLYIEHYCEKDDEEKTYEQSFTKEISRDDYLQQVGHIKNLITEQKLEKLVLSRISPEPIPENFKASLLFELMNQTYTDAFVYMLYIPDAGLWCGASPEPLLLVSGTQAETVSLAGTRAASETIPPLPWNEKETTEQQMVTTYIEEVLHSFKATDYQKTTPYTYKAGEIEHLRTDFRIPLNSIQPRIFEFVEALHPTPSVCGLPKNASLREIFEAEPHNREYYTGFLGPVDINQQWGLYVNLRCLKATHDSLGFYLGAGITEGSDPLKEWDETESKKSTLYNMVKKIIKY